jgi:NADH-quinone oxidoreductase subunit C
MEVDAGKLALDAIAGSLGDRLQVSQFRGELCWTVPRDSVYSMLERLRDEAGMAMLIDVTAVDLLEMPEAADRFRVVYLLLDPESGRRLEVRTLVNDPNPQLPSVFPLWRSADWLEREVFDMFGISFPGHPDLRRLLLPPEFVSHPLRKDYPLAGRGERHNFPVLTRAES